MYNKITMYKILFLGFDIELVIFDLNKLEKFLYAQLIFLLLSTSFIRKTNEPYHLKNILNLTHEFLNEVMKYMSLYNYSRTTQKY